MTELLILTHNGMGDQLICNGLVRHLASKHPGVAIVCKAASADSVSFMYRDRRDIRVLPVQDDCQISPTFGANPSILQGLQARGFKILLLGLHRGYLAPGSGFACMLYDQAQVPRSSRYFDFHVDRDPDMERHFRAEGDYVFLHDDSERGFEIQYDNHLKIVRPGKADHRPLSNNIFAFIGLMEGAAELHLIDSSFSHLADLVNILPGKRYLHCIKNPSDRVEDLFLRPGWHFVR